MSLGQCVVSAATPSLSPQNCFCLVSLSDFRLFGKDILKVDICYGDAPLHIIFPSVYMNAAVQLNNLSYRQGTNKFNSKRRENNENDA